jgi:hypothetical protein
MAANVRVGRRAPGRLLPRSLVSPNDDALGSKAAVVRRRLSIARLSHRICAVSQLMCVGQPLPSQIICTGKAIYCASARLLLRAATAMGGGHPGERGARDGAADMTRLVFLHGAPASGKLTVAKALLRALPGRLFDNHSAIDLARTLFDSRPPGSDHVWLSSEMTRRRKSADWIRAHAPESIRPLPSRAIEIFRLYVARTPPSRSHPCSRNTRGRQRAPWL